MLIRTGKLFKVNCDRCNSIQFATIRSITNIYDFGWTYNDNARKYKTLCPLCSKKVK